MVIYLKPCRINKVVNNQYFLTFVGQAQALRLMIIFENFQTKNNTKGEELNFGRIQITIFRRIEEGKLVKLFHESLREFVETLLIKCIDITQ